jgi:hypothetical protein
MYAQILPLPIKVAQPRMVLASPSAQSELFSLVSILIRAFLDLNPYGRTNRFEWKTDLLI